MSLPLVIGYRHTGIIVKDMKKSLHFYKDILGLKVIQDFSDSSEYINKITGIKNADVHMIKLKAEDETVLEILEYSNHPTELMEYPIYNVGVCHIALQVRNANDAYNKLIENNVRIISKPVLSSEKIAKVFFCFDPNDVRIELVEMLDEH
jgi:catechol 2,3-dioxygenase-like lactoylglutathione lyase family enzyme